MAEANELCDLREFAKDLGSLERSLLERFLSESPLCVASDKVGQIDRAQLPSPEKLIKNVKHFLGYHMIKQFDVLNFLEDTGTYIEGMEDTDDEPDVIERKWLRPVFEAAPTVVHRLLTWLSEKGVYKSEDLKIALGVAEMSIDELPCCALLSQYLPGPRHSAYELCHADTAFPMGSGMVATTLQARYQDTCPSLNYWGLAASACRDTMKVKEEHSKRMHATRIGEGGRISFATCLQGSSASQESEGDVVIQFDAPIAALFRVGMIVTAIFQQLSNGSTSRWELSSPGYVWPSWHCEKGCMSSRS
ncbi:hypothetical protein WJX75_003114 [Coccomyxa subellipsoidea]|uniref:Uncharacterized protein n=1 Tax=Coccomyxa subellipsoidea TaxID=248742 RepID=A0ABR2YG75_9CHLO